MRDQSSWLPLGKGDPDRAVFDDRSDAEKAASVGMNADFDRTGLRRWPEFRGVAYKWTRNGWTKYWDDGEEVAERSDVRGRFSLSPDSSRGVVDA